MKVLVTGGTGFTGTAVVERLLAEGHSVRCLVRARGRAELLPAGAVEIAPGDVADPGALSQSLAGVDAAVNIVNMLATPVGRFVELAEQAGVRRVLFFGTTAIFTTVASHLRARRLQAEQTIAHSPIPWNILRPTMIFGGPRDGNISKLIAYLERWPVIPVFGDGQALQQPVHVSDLANAVSAILARSDVPSAPYNLPGGAPVSFDGMIDEICRCLGRRVLKAHLPARWCASAAAALEKRSIRPPVKSEQILRLLESKNIGYEDAARDFDYRPLTFAQGVERQIRGNSPAAASPRAATGSA